MLATPERRVFAACLVLSSLLHALAAMLFQPVVSPPDSVQLGTQLTIHVPSSLAVEKPSPDTASPPASQNVQEEQASLIPVEVPKPVALRIDPFKFYSGAEVDFRSEPAGEVTLVYPTLPPGSPTAGKVVLELRIDETGLVIDARVVEATHPGLFDVHAIDAFRKVAFLPARLNGTPVKSVKWIEVGYEDMLRRGNNSKSP